jgi:hypothetical protein
VTALSDGWCSVRAAPGYQHGTSGLRERSGKQPWSGVPVRTLKGECDRLSTWRATSATCCPVDLAFPLDSASDIAKMAVPGAFAQKSCNKICSARRTISCP